ncbi:hypothetical protein BRD07_08320 [Halobacteriales archaeon QS_9_68_42]|nr:MAG: hypothetical protein BRC84_03390 [Halobacteriales archaeon QS_1_68_44]PSQ39856.1 MAG: hypothetical protein BRD07_08320 [Halobacteriales archaeon QS_9_68_42]
MSVAGLCEICEGSTVEDSCDRCGRVVCAKHYDTETGYCTDCLSELGRRPSEGGERNEPDRPDGVEEHRF